MRWVEWSRRAANLVAGERCAKFMSLCMDIWVGGRAGGWVGGGWMKEQEVGGASTHGLGGSAAASPSSGEQARQGTPTCRSAGAYRLTVESAVVEPASFQARQGPARRQHPAQLVVGPACMGSAPMSCGGPAIRVGQARLGSSNSSLLWLGTMRSGVKSRGSEGVPPSPNAAPFIQTGLTG